MNQQAVSTEQVWDWLGQVQDPEIPVISVVDLGIVRYDPRTDSVELLKQTIDGKDVARCLLHYVMVHSARSYIGRNTSFPALKLPSDQTREIAYS